MMGLAGLFQKARTATAPEPAVLDIDGKAIAVVFRRNALARRFTLRMNRSGDGAVVTMPKRASRAEALRFAESSRLWVANQLLRQKPKLTVAHGHALPFQGEPHTIDMPGGTRGLVRLDRDRKVIVVPGNQEHVPRRLEDWLKQQAKLALTEATIRYATAMNLRYQGVTVRDQKTRWGSCSSSGELSYSWRLVLAPHYVLDYVAAHEVAHLAEMNHGPKFWRLVLTHCAKAADAKRWLKSHGQDLHRFTTKP